MYSMNGMYSAEMRERMLTNDRNQNNNKRICIAECPKIKARVNGVCTEISMNTSAELSLISQKFTCKHNQQFERSQVVPINNIQLQICLLYTSRCV